MRSIAFEARLSTKLEVHYAPYKTFPNIEAAGGQSSEQKNLDFSHLLHKNKMASG